MVYCGKPSKGCASCRTRRIKCDQKRPSCGQCFRAAKPCEGYRDSIELSFRDENDRITSKVKARKASTQAQLSVAKATEGKPLLPLPNHQAPDMSIILDESHVLVQSTIFPSLQTVQEDQGIRFFFSGCVGFLLDPEARAGYIGTTSLQRILLPQIYTSQTLFNTVSSIGYAGLTNITKEYKYRVLARQNFASALEKVLTALKNPAVADLESIFKSVMLLSSFQLMSEPTQQTIDWSAHIEGGAAMLQHMELKRSRDIPIRVQLKLCLALFSKYIAKGQRCSKPVLNWLETLSHSIAEEDRPAILLAELLIEFIDLNALIRQPDSMDSTNAITELLELDTKFALWEAQIPQDWHYEVSLISVGEPGNLSQRELVRYRDLWTAKVWNDYRWGRIMLNEIIVRHVVQHSTLSFESEARVRQSLRLNSLLAKSICSSVSADLTLRRSLGMFIGGTSLEGSFLILYPLSIAAGGIGVEESVHKIAVGRLDNVGKRSGLLQASILVERSIQQREEWRSFLGKWMNIDDL